MNKQQLDRLMRIARKTNSPVIILDENKEEMVILPLAAYEHLVDDALIGIGSFDDYIDENIEESIDLSNQDISEDFADEHENSQEVEAKVNIETQKSNEKFDEEQFYLEPIE
jgi:PHD/YefM family antitoxin component YafN of YafNO toxin-antitoxin module